MTTFGLERRARWWHTLYWRVGIGFVAFVVALLLVQSAIFIYWVDRPGEAQPAARPAATGDRPAAANWATPSSAADRSTSRPSWVRSPIAAARSTSCSPTARRSRAGGGPVPEGARQTALLMLRGDAPGAGQPLTGGPATYAPIQAGGMLKGFVIAAPPPLSGVLREFTRVLSPQNFLLLLGLTAVAALILVGPARRRLAGLEAAALRVAGGNLGARAADDGRDEVSMVARAFNRMSAELAARDAALQAAIRLAAAAVRRRVARAEDAADVDARLSRDPADGRRRPAAPIAAHRYLGTVLDETHAARADRRRPRRSRPRREPRRDPRRARLRAGAGVRARDAAARARGAAAIDHHPRRRRARRRSALRRSGSPRAGRREPGRQRAALRARRRHDRARRGGLGRHRLPQGGRHRRRHRGRAPAARLRSLLQGGSGAGRGRRRLGAARQRAGAVHRQGDRRAPRRPHRGVERAGPHRLHRDAAARQRRRRRAWSGRRGSVSRPRTCSRRPTR